MECGHLITIDIPTSVENIGAEAFSGCSSLKNIEIPNEITCIEALTFCWCASLESIEIPNSVTSIEYLAFNGCSELTSVYVPESIESISEDAFEGCNEDFTIYGIANSYAQTYAEENDINFIVWDGSDLSGGSSDTDISDYDLTRIDILEQVDSDTVYFESLFSATINSSTDTSNQGQWESWIGKEVLVGYENTLTADGNLVDYLQGMQLIDSYNFGLVSDIGEGYIVIDGVEYEQDCIESNSYYIYTNNHIMYYLIGNQVVSISSLLTDEFTLDAYNESANTVVLDGKTYTISPLAKWEDGYVKSIGDSIDREVEAVVDKGEMVFYGVVDQSSEFNLPVYQAKITYNDNMPTTIDTMSASYYFVEEAEENGLANTAACWEAVTGALDAYDNPLSLAEFEAQQEDIYTALLMTIISDSSNVSIIQSDVDYIMGQSKELTSILKDCFKDETGWIFESTDSLEKLTESDKEAVTASMEDIFSSEGLFDDSIALIGDVLAASDTIEDFVNRILFIESVISMSDSMKEIITQMNANCPSTNTAMKAALANCEEVMYQTESELIDQILLDTIEIAGVNAGEMIFEKFWDQATNIVEFMLPGMKVLMAAYSASKYLTNELLSTEEILERYYYMIAITNLEVLAKATLEDVESQYVIMKDSETQSLLYLSAIETLYKIKDESCIQAYNFIDTIDSARITALLNAFNDSNDREATVETIASLQESFYVDYVSVAYNWFLYLEMDYPDSGLYEEYEYLYGEALNARADKEYVKIACPVDVYVYNKNNELVASIIDNDIVTLTAETITIVVQDDVKTLYLDRGDEYRIECIGNDSGEMDIEIINYDSDGEAITTEKYYDIPLSDGIEYSLQITEEDVDKREVIFSEDDTTIQPDVSSSESTEKYTVKVESGVLEVDGQYATEYAVSANDRIELMVIIPDGYSFSHWSSDVGNSIFEDANASETIVIMPSEEVKITANFVSENNAIGDVNGNDTVNVTDVMMMYKHINEVEELTEAQIEIADVSGDGVVNVTDVMIIYKHINEVELLF